jgi:Flp pilus assembly protein TadD
MAKARPPKRRNGGAPAPRARQQTVVVRLAALLIVVSGALAYANSLTGPFIFDDRRAVLDNASIRQLSTALRPAAQTPVAGRPIANFSFAINYALGEHEVEGYHLWNIGVHILAALTLFGLLRRIAPWAASPSSERTADDRQTANGLAFIAATAWLLHPLNTEAVDYITQRTESMVGLFYLLTLYAAVRAWSVRPSWHWEIAAVAANLCGMATKESMVTAPLMVLLCDHVFAFPSFKRAFTERRRLYAGLAAGWILFAVLARVTPFFAAKGFASHVSPWTYLLNQPPVILRYLRLSIWPRSLLLDYGGPRALTLTEVWPSALLLVALLGLTVVGFVRVQKLGFWGAWFFITLAPASSILPIPTEVGAERRMYLPLIAIIVLIVWVAWRLGFVRRAWPVVAGVVLLGLAAATFARNAEYRSGVSIWQTVLDRRPSSSAHTNMAVELVGAGQVDEAVKHLWIAAPDDPEAKHMLGSALLERGQVHEAAVQLEGFVRSNPDDVHIVQAREELALALSRDDRSADAIAQLRLVVAAAPAYVLGRVNLGNLLSSSGDFAGAVAEYSQALRAQPNNLFAARNLGMTLAAADRLDEALAALRQAQQVDPRDVTTERTLVDVLLRQRRFTDAEKEVRGIVSVLPNDADAHNLLGITMASEGRLDEATEEFQTASRLNPQLRDAKDNLARAVEERRRGRLPAHAR